ncbi:MAG: alpha/beta hydrolase [Flavobacteriales bacterium]|nr:alpha/beta hydrolase [Flavobacteriales bacterium]MBL6872480.1 alpha/beta hydrolase [Flavobacteriales bacterium]
MMKQIFASLLIMVSLISCNKDGDNISPPVISAPIVKLNTTYEVSIAEDITYAEGLSHDSWNSANTSVVPLLMDSYVPDNDVQNRPLLMLIHGGGFSGGSKQQEALVYMANYYASRGFVVFSIDYRLRGDKGTIPQEWIDATTNVDPAELDQLYAMYPAHRDAKAALRWIIANADNYHINTDYITVGGGSAGAITSIGLGVSELGDYKDEISLSEDNTLSTTNLSQTYEVKTILDFWGSGVSIEILESIYGYQKFDSNDPALFIAHGTEDPTVPFSSAEDLKTIWETNKIDFVYYPLEGKGHGAWGATVNGKSLSDLSFDFIVENQSLNVE